ncbi:hypothetical protein BC940DRAFT_315414 [Gongronella butleri]|nr:hypothetical protein BC940DRAFT_315414 [Gongronella butleri]
MNSVLVAESAHSIPREKSGDFDADVAVYMKQQEQIAQQTIAHYMGEHEKSQVQVRQLQLLVEKQDRLIDALYRQQDALRAAASAAASSTPVGSLAQAKHELESSIDTLKAGIDSHHADMAMIMMVSTEIQNDFDQYKAAVAHQLDTLHHDLAKKDAILAHYGLHASDMLSLPSLESNKHTSSSSTSTTHSSTTSAATPPQFASPPSSPPPQPPAKHHPFVVQPPRISSQQQMQPILPTQPIQPMHPMQQPYPTWSTPASPPSHSSQPIVVDRPASAQPYASNLPPPPPLQQPTVRHRTSLDFLNANTTSKPFWKSVKKKLRA